MNVRIERVTVDQPTADITSIGSMMVSRVATGPKTMRLELVVTDMEISTSDIEAMQRGGLFTLTPADAASLIPSIGIKKLIIDKPGAATDTPTTSAENAW